MKNTLEKAQNETKENLNLILAENILFLILIVILEKSKIEIEICSQRTNEL